MAPHEVRASKDSLDTLDTGTQSSIEQEARKRFAIDLIKAVVEIKDMRGLGDTHTEDKSYRAGINRACLDTISVIKRMAGMS